MSIPAHKLSTGGTAQAPTAPPPQAGDMNSRLAEAISGARTLVLRNASRLATFVAHKATARTAFACTPETIFGWLADVEFRVSNRMTHTYGVAYTDKNLITLNAHTIATTTDDDLEDLLLHELGHLFIARFIDPREGHDYNWRWVGFILGYAPVGCTADERRARMRTSMLTYRMAASGGLLHPELGL